MVAAGAVVSPKPSFITCDIPDLTGSKTGEVFFVSKWAVVGCG